MTLSKDARSERGAGDGSAGPWTILRRAVLLRCPNCGGRDVRATYFDFKASCPACGVRFDRGEEDYWIGGFMLNFIVAELIVVVAIVAAILLTWPAVPWTLVMYGGLIPAVAGPVVAYPVSRNVWFALDLIFRPAEPEDFGGVRPG